VSDRSLSADELDLLRTMVEADETASREGDRDETFAVLRLNGGETFLDHKGFRGERPKVSARAVAGLSDAGLFRVVSETESLLRVYLIEAARSWLQDDVSASVDQPHGTAGLRDDQDRLLQLVLDHFLRTAEWPLVDTPFDTNSIKLMTISMSFEPGASWTQNWVPSASAMGLAPP
jgi:hypothetical protein